METAYLATALTSLGYSKDERDVVFKLLENNGQLKNLSHVLYLYSENELKKHPNAGIENSPLVRKTVQDIISGYGVPKPSSPAGISPVTPPSHPDNPSPAPNDDHKKTLIIASSVLGGVVLVGVLLYILKKKKVIKF